MGEGESGGGSKFAAVTGSFISPGIGILKSWQGIVEISLRVAIAVSIVRISYMLCELGWAWLSC